MEKKMNFFRKFENINKSSNFLRALEFSILENLGHCRKNSLDTYYNKLTRNEIKLLREAGLKKGFFFFFFYSKDSKKLRQMLINIFFNFKRQKFYEKNFYFLDSFFQSNNHKILQKMGYYSMKLGSKKVLVNFEYIEQLEKKKRLKNKENKKSLNSFEKLYTKLPRKFIFFD